MQITSLRVHDPTDTALATPTLSLDMSSKCHRHKNVAEENARPKPHMPGPSKIGHRQPQYPHIIGVRISAVAYMQTQEALLSSHTAGDYAHATLPDVLRAALRAFFRDRELTAAPLSGPKKKTTIALDDDLKRNYDLLPPRKRGEILERALLSYLKNGLRD